ncbi:MAG: DUF87 domain-containing protein [Geminicoccaceae bacterium]|nr:DUF87 domain-containing protein [Geminicoccaceae bacterium]
MTVIGRVVAVSGSQVVATISEDAGSAERVEKGQLVKIPLPQTHAFAIVSALSIPMPDTPVRLMELALVGECRHRGDGGRFHRGLSAYPALGDPVLAIEPRDLAAIRGAEGPETIPLGALHRGSGRIVHVDPDRLLGRHFAVLGATGSGKSCAVASILHTLVERGTQAHILVLDPHGEYASAFRDRAVVLGQDNLELPYWLLTGEELVEVVGGGRDPGPQRAAELLLDFVARAKGAYRDANGDHRPAVDTPVPYRLSDVIRLIDEVVGRLDRTESVAAYRWLKNRLEILSRDPRFAFLFGGIAVRDDMARILGTLFRIPADGRPITVVDLSGIPNEVLEVVVSVLLRLAFDLAYWSRGRIPVLILCEEAHRCAPSDKSRGFAPTRLAMARIAKEGRKYGVALGLVSQRPSDLEPSVLSQCGTVLAFRVTSPHDQELVHALLRDDANGLLDFLPSLGDGEAIVLGQAVPFPVRLQFPELSSELRPRRASPSFSRPESAEEDPIELLESLVRAWRRR